MKYLFFLPHYPSFCWSGIYGVILDQVEVLAREGHSVRLVYCSDCRTLGACYHNHTHPERVCKLCNFNRNYLLSKLSKKVEKIPVSAWSSAVNTPPAMKYDSIDDILKLQYKGVHIGYAAMSTYISYGVRNLYPLLDDPFRAYLNALLDRCCRYTDVVEAAIADYQPDSVGLFNARLVDDRPVVDICRREGIDFTCYEHRFILGNQPRKTSYHNTTPHNEADVRKRIEEIWNDPSAPMDDRIALGKSFFENRRNAIAAGDKVYTGDQKTGLLPEGWDKSKHNIVIFNSSEDEMSYVLEDNQAGALFPTQLDGFDYLFKKFKDRDDIHFYIRVHPNLKNIPYLYSTLLPKYGEKYDNVTVIPGDSPISTYSLIDVADKVLVFGSTAGAEAAYAGRPTILVAGSVYTDLGICYVPRTVEELEELLLDKDLPAKDGSGALKMGYYYLRTYDGDFQYFKVENKYYSILGKPLRIQRFDIDGHKGTQWRTCFNQTLCKIFYETLPKIELPVKEDVAKYEKYLK